MRETGLPLGLPALGYGDRDVASLVNVFVDRANRRPV